MTDKRNKNQTRGIPPFIWPAFILAFMLLLPLFINKPYIIHLMIMGMIWSIVASAWNMVAGYVGIFSLGQIGFLGIGGYASALLCMNFGIPPLVCIFLGGLLAAVTGLLISLPILRLRGAYIAMLTLAFSEVVHFLDSNLEWLTRGEMSLWGIPPLFDTAGKTPYYYTMLFFLSAVAVFLQVFTKSKYWLAAIAIKKSENSAESLGVNVKLFKIEMFCISAFFTGIAGGLYAHYVCLLSPVFIQFSHMIDVLAMGILGGIGTVAGPIIGAFVITLFLEYFRFLGEYRFLAYGILLIVVILFKPQGLYPGVMDLVNRFKPSQKGVNTKISEV
jgi:branched-chain amino acid transport system permease protein